MAGAPLARYWVHNGFLSMAGVGEDVEEPRQCGDRRRSAGQRATRARCYRFALLSAHYRQPLEWSREPDRAEQGDPRPALPHRRRRAAAARRIAGVLDALADDLNTPLALSRLSAIEDGATLRRERGPARPAGARRLGLVPGRWRQPDRRPGRRAHRGQAERDFAEADRIRAELAAEGIACSRTGRKGRVGGGPEPL